MKKIIQKYGWMLVMSAVTLGLLLFCARQTPTLQTAGSVHEERAVTKPEDVLRFRVEGAPASAELSPYKMSDGIYYVVLPSFARQEQTYVLLTEGAEISLGGTVLSDGMDCGALELETEYPLVIGDDPAGHLKFVCSANVPTLYINTESGSMAQIHADKNHEEGAAMTLVSADGVILHSDPASLLKGRGNTTWMSQKKPYLLTLSVDGDLLEMGAATKWVLLSNSVDETNLRNKVILDLAADVGFVWSPQAEYVDVYLNGQYNGLYLLAEKVEAGPNRLNLDLENGDFLCRLDADFRWEEFRYPIRTPYGRTVEISDPKQITTGRKNDIGERTAEMERIILSGEDLSTAERFDLDSWVRRYLVDEISGNIDAELASCYFYCADGVMYGGPVWDYDMTMGSSFRNKNPETFIVKNKYITSTMFKPYYDALFENDSFQKRLREIYRAEFKPVLDKLVNGGFYEQAEYIRQASLINNARWRTMYDNYYAGGEFLYSDVEMLYSYLNARVDFLNSAWVEGKEYCTVQVEYDRNGPYWNIAVEKGSRLEAAPIDTVDIVWYDNWTGEVVGPDAVIDRDRILTRDYAPQKETTMVVVTRFSVLVMAGMLVILVAADFRMRRKERRKDNERTDSRISS